MQFFEDIGIGDRAEIGRHTFTAEEIKAFATRFDPQPFHLDEVAAASSLFGRLCASGWHTTCLWMRLVVEYRQRQDTARQARGEPVAALGVSAGFRDLRWPTPVYVGDTVTYATEVIKLRPSVRRPEWGIMTAHNTGAINAASRCCRSSARFSSSADRSACHERRGWGSDRESGCPA